MITMIELLLNELSKNKKKIFTIDFRLKNTLILLIISIFITYIRLKLINFNFIFQCLITATGIESIFSYFHLNKYIRIIIEIFSTIFISILLTSTFII